MLTLALSRAASALLQALLQRVGDDRDRILLSRIKSTDWQSLVFVGERHVMQLRIPGPEADLLTSRLVDGIEDAEFSIRGQIVADIVVVRSQACALDGSVTLEIEAPTVAE